MSIPRSPREQPEWLQVFLSHSHRRQYPDRTTIIHGGDEPDTLFYILRGSVSVVIEDEEGRELVLAYLNEGDFFGEMGLFDEQPHRTARVVARTDCVVAEARYESFVELAQREPGMLFELASQLSGRLQRTNIRIRDLAFLDVTGRVARTLLDLAGQAEAMTHPDGMQVQTTRQELARLAGCTRETAGRVLKDLEEQGLIRLEGRHLVVIGARPE